MNAISSPIPHFEIAEQTLLRPHGLAPHQLERIFGQLLGHHVDYADLYFQYQRSEAWSLEEGIVKSGSFNIEQGVGVRALCGEKTAFAYSDDISLKALHGADEAAHTALQQLIHVGTSAGGARAKAVVAFNPRTSQVRSSYGPHEVGFEDWLIKLDGVSAAAMDGHDDRLGDEAPYGRIEYAYALMAGAAGVEMSRCQLLAEGPRRHFMTRRFDRGEFGERHHVLSLCAMAHLDFNMTGVHSYDQYLQTVRALDLGPDALQQAYRRMVFNVMAVNRDDHTKNFAFLRRESGDWELAPAFDVTHAYNPRSRWIAWRDRGGTCR